MACRWKELKLEEFDRLIKQATQMFVMVAIETMYNTVQRGADNVPIYSTTQVETTQALDMLTKDNKATEMGAGLYKLASQCLTHNRNTHCRSKRAKSFKSRRNIHTEELQHILNGYSHTECILSKISDWSFDVFALDKATNGRALFHVILRLFQHHDLINDFNLDPVRLMNFATLVEKGYRSNPYHNAVHAADVTQAMHCYISQKKIAKHMTPIEILIALVSAITHDLDHPGVNQGFLIATKNNLATQYENQAVLENHHWRMAMKALNQTGLFKHLTENVRATIEQGMKSLILATDMTRQQEFFSILRDRVNTNTLDMAEREDRHFILQIALKCADISNPCRHWSTCKTWSEKVCEEFFNQGDLERDLGLPISNLCDRYSNTIPKIQAGFIGFVVDPLFAEFERYLFPCSMLSEQLTHLRGNRERWQDKIEKATKQAIRPNSLDLSIIPTEPVISDIPSPTHSIDDEDGCEETPQTDLGTSCSCDPDQHDRRHSVPVLNLLRRSRGLTRRQSFPNSFLLRANELDSIDRVILLENLAGQLMKLEDTNNNKTESMDNSYTEILHNVLSSSGYPTAVSHHNNTLPRFIYQSVSDVPK